MLPRLKPHVAIAQLDDENVLVRGAGVFLRYSGEAVPVLLAMAPLLDGTRDAARLAKETGLPEADVRDVVQGLVEDRLVEDAAADEAPTTPGGDPQTRAWSILTHRPHAAQRRAASARMLVLGSGEVADHARRALEALGVARVSTVGEADTQDHVVVCTDEPDARGFAEANERALAAGVPATYAFLDGAEATIGPTVIPRESACWRCYDLRALGAHPNPERWMMARAIARPPVARFATWPMLVGGQVAQAALVAVAGAGVPPLAGHVSRVDLLTLQARRHRVLRIPRCPACSGADVPDVDRYAPEGLEP
jgi:bacteriocin biosynthesis cyclodehydratase domain-containing protein